MKALRLVFAGVVLSLGVIGFAQVNAGTTQYTPSIILYPGIPNGATIPRVVSSEPPNGATKVNPSIHKITITFDQPMDVATFYWPIPQASDFPAVTADPFWINGNKTVVLPIALSRNATYHIPLNVGSTITFRSATGVPLNAGVISFYTGGSSSSSASTGQVPGFTPAGVRIASDTPRIPGEGGTLGGAVNPATGNFNVNNTPVPVVPTAGGGSGPFTNRATTYGGVQALQRTPLPAAVSKTPVVRRGARLTPTPAP